MKIIKKNLVSIIITSYNSEKYIKKTLDSVISQTYQNFEVIVVDDCSSDKTYAILKKYEAADKRFKIFKLKKNSGTASVPRNYGILRSEGEFLSFLDSDDVWLKNKLHIQIKELKKKNADIVFSACDYVYSNEKIASSILIKYIRIIFQKIFSKILIKNTSLIYLFNPIVFSSVLLKRKKFLNLKFDTNQKLAGIEDLDLWINIIKKNTKLLFLETTLVKNRRRKDSLHSNYLRQSIKSVYSFSTHFLSNKKFSNTNIFLIAIFIKILRPLLKKNFYFFYQNLIKIFSLLILVYFLFFFSPLLKFFGKYLLYHDNSFSNINHVVINSGPGQSEYINNGYLKRYIDINKNFNSNGYTFYLLGRLQLIPEQKILESLLVNDGISKDNINVIYKQSKTTRENIINIKRILESKNIDKVIFITSPYNSLRSKLLWDKNVKNIDAKFLKTSDWPDDKYSWFKKAYNKKAIIYEYLAIIYNFIKGWL